jgi:hypothetical protein
MSNTNDVLAVLNAQQAAHTPHMPDTMPMAGEWMPTTPAPSVWPTIREHIVDMVTHQPRSLQREIGPSELGTQCLHCLARKLTGHTTEEIRDVAWLPFIGTSVHAQFEHMFSALDGYETEKTVLVGNLTDARPITGSIDLWDEKNAATCDWKIVGNSTLADVRRHGPSQQYKIQASLYGIGMSHTHPVQTSCIYYLPRNQPSLDAGWIYETTFDPRPGQWALARARLILTLYDSIRVEYGDSIAEQWVNAFPRNTEHCFHCRDEAQRRNPADLASLIGTKTVDAADTRTLADNLPAMPRALLNVPQADYRPQPTNKPTTDTNPKGQQS